MYAVPCIVNPVLQRWTAHWNHQQRTKCFDPQAVSLWPVCSNFIWLNSLSHDPLEIGQTDKKLTSFYSFGAAAHSFLNTENLRTMSDVSYGLNPNFCTTGQFQRLQTKPSRQRQQCNNPNVTPRTVDSTGWESRQDSQHLGLTRRW